MSKHGNFNSQTKSNPALKERTPHFSLLEREKEYQQLNAQLEAHTSKLVQEADNMLKEQETFLNQVSSPQYQPSLVTRNSVEKIPNPSIIDVIGHDTDLLSVAAGGFNDDNSDDEILAQRTNTGYFSSDFKKSKPSSRAGAAKKSKKLEADAVQPRALQEDKDSAVLNAAEEMGSEAQIRFLKAKLRVLQEELQDETEKNLSAGEECRKFKEELKEAKEELEKMKKSYNVQQNNIKKIKSGFEEEKKKSEAKTAQLQNLKKELDLIKREQKQANVSHSATEVRLNRATEELDKVKAQLQKYKASDKESSSHEQKKFEQLNIENKRLERLRNDSLTVIKKQQKLIGILKRQILHIEAAKLLSFTEGEFVKALDWGNK